MSIKFRNYNHPNDYKLVDDFLIQQYQADNLDGNWIEPAWEYMHGHPYLDRSSLEKIGLWDDDGKLLAVSHFESRLGEAFFEFHHDHKYLMTEMLDHAERTLHGISDDGKKYLRVFINETDKDFVSLVKARGYKRDPESDRPMAKFNIPDSFPPITLPAGFHLTSLADDCDWAKIHRVLWRGFNNEGEPPAGDEELESRRRMFETPKARHDLKIAVQAPNGDFVAFCGMFYESTSKYAYVEPVATDPDYRRMGLGKAAVLEGIRRCGIVGATVAYMGSDLEFYLSIGFKVIHTTECWLKYFDAR